MTEIPSGIFWKQNFKGVFCSISVHGGYFEQELVQVITESSILKKVSVREYTKIPP